MSVPPALTPLEVLHDVDTGGYPLPADLQTLYGGPLRFSPPVLYGNFVASIDGVVAIRSIRSPGSLIGAHSVGDRFVMGLLRACADAVLIGAGTLRDVSRHRWTPAGICPELAASYGELRRRLRKAAEPTLVVVTAGGDLDPRHPALESGAVVLTTRAAAPRLAANLPATCSVQSLADVGPLDVRAVLGAVRSVGFGDVLSEAGPTMTGQLLAQGLLDELFLTVSPVLIGGGRASRPGMAGGTRLEPTGAPWGELVSSRRHGSHLFLRYRARTR